MYKQNKQAMANFVYNSVVAVFIFQTEWVWLFDVPNSALFLVKRSALSKQSKVHQGKLFSIIIKEETAWRKIHWKHNCWHSTTLSIWWISCLCLENQVIQRNLKEKSIKRVFDQCHLASGWRVCAMLFFYALPLQCGGQVWWSGSHSYLWYHNQAGCCLQLVIYKRKCHWKEKANFIENQKK